MAKILIVDDARVIRKVLKKIISDNGWETVGEAANGNIGFELYKELKPDLVLLDITMPECNGLEALELIMKFDSNAKVLMITAVEDRAAIIETMKLGAIDYILKPINADRVTISIKKVIEGVK